MLNKYLREPPLLLFPYEWLWADIHMGTKRSLSNNSMQPFVGKQSCDGCDPFTLSPSVLHFKIFTAFYVKVTFATGGYEQDLQRVKVLGSNFQTNTCTRTSVQHTRIHLSIYFLSLLVWPSVQTAELVRAVVHDSDASGYWHNNE